jgi:hypothetical protein
MIARDWTCALSFSTLDPEPVTSERTSATG